MSRKNKNRQPKRTKPKEQPQTVKQGKNYISDMTSILNTFIETRGIVMEIVSGNMFTFYKDDPEYDYTFKDKLIKEVEKNHTLKIKDDENSFSLIFKS